MHNPPTTSFAPSARWDLLDRATLFQALKVRDAVQCSFDKIVSAAKLALSSAVFSSDLCHSFTDGGSASTHCEQAMVTFSAHVLEISFDTQANISNTDCLEVLTALNRSLAEIAVFVRAMKRQPTSLYSDERGSGGHYHCDFKYHSGVLGKNRLGEISGSYLGQLVRASESWV